MRRSGAVAGSLLHFIAAPGVVAGLVPWLLTDWQSGASWVPARAAGAFLIVAGVLALVDAFARFVLEGRGTPAPVAPTERLVVGGLYRHVRNPMYLAVAAIIAGQALALGRPVLLAYTAVILGISVAFVRSYEEPVLRRQFGVAYEDYAAVVPAWLPRARPVTAGREPREAGPGRASRGSARRGEMP